MIVLFPDVPRRAAICHVIQVLTGVPPHLAMSTEDALALAGQAPPQALVAVDRLGGCSTLPALAKIRRRTPGCLLAVLARAYDPVIAAEAARLGLSGVMLWPDKRPGGLAAGLGAALLAGTNDHGDSPKQATARLVPAPLAERPLPERTPTTVTPVQAGILDRLIRGTPQGVIAEGLGLGRRTVERHIATLRDQYGAPTTAVLVERAARLGYHARPRPKRRL